MIRLLAALPGLVIGLAWLLGLVVQDRWLPLGWLYFIPAPAVLLTAWLPLLAPPKSAAVLVRAVGGLLFAGALAKLTLSDMAWHRPDPDVEPWVRVVQWNLDHGNRMTGPPEILRDLESDVLVLHEMPRERTSHQRVLDYTGLPHRTGAWFAQVQARWPLRTLGRPRLISIQALHLRVDHPDRPFELLAVDAPSAYFYDRTAMLRSLADWVDARPGDLPLLVIGDFNTPCDYRAFAPLRKHLVPAYEASGRGWPYTWPSPVPMLALDQAWVSPDLPLHQTRHINTRQSDHALLVVELGGACDQ